MSQPQHPLQPLVRDSSGTVRFKANAIVRAMLEMGRKGQRFDLNELAAGGFSNEDFTQLAQLIGYSLSGFGELSYVSDETFGRAEQQPVHDGKEE